MKNSISTQFIPSSMKKILLLVLPCVLLLSCQSEFESINTDPTKISNGQLVTDGAIFSAAFKQMQLGICLPTPEWKTQLQENLNSDLYSGYMAIPTPFNSDQNNSHYFMMDGWNAFISSIAADEVLLPALSIQKNLSTYNPLGKSLFEAWLKILKVEAMHRVCDKFGPIVYSNFGNAQSDGSFLYDTQEEAYTLFFKQLGEAIDTLYTTQETVKRFSSDLVYGSDYKKWAKFANSLRLRLSLRIAFINPTKAKQEAEKSLSSAAGLITDNSENFTINIGALTHPLNTFNYSWNDIRMGAPMDVYLNGFKDDRLSKYFVVSDSSKKTSTPEYKGIRQGIPISAKTVYQDLASKVAVQASKIQLMTAAEVYFLLAEANLRGFSMGNYTGTLQELYNTGISKSFEQYGLSASSYVTNTSNMAPADFKDAVQSSGDVTFSNKIPVALHASDKQIQFQQIITQKWIAMFPEGDEAWAEQRRTGYPTLIPLKEEWKKTATSDGKIAVGEYIKRLTIPQSEIDKNPVGYAAIKTFGKTTGEKDEISTRVWWDVQDKTIP